MASDLTSRPYQPDPAQCCEGCVFGGEHAAWCEFGATPEQLAEMEQKVSFVGNRLRNPPLSEVGIALALHAAIEAESELMEAAAGTLIKFHVDVHSKPFRMWPTRFTDQGHD